MCRGVTYLQRPTIALFLVDRIKMDVVIRLGIHVSEVTVDMAFLPLIAEQLSTPPAVLMILIKLTFDIYLFQI